MNKGYMIGLIIFGMLGMLLWGCAGKEAVEEGWTESQAKEILTFKDVHGQTYQMEVNPDIAKKEYADSGFSRQGDKLSYSDDTYTSRLGVDVSYYQGEIDWEKVKADGYEFAFIRLGYRGYGEEGTLNLDERFHENIRNAREAGLDVGVYFFAQAVNEEEAVEEAEFVLDALEGYELQMPVVYDPESVADEEARTNDVTGEQFTRNTDAFCRRISEAGYESMIYCNMMWEAFELDLEQLSDYPVWYADYQSFPQTPYHFEMWQYTEQGTVAGISTAADINIQFLKR